MREYWKRATFFIVIGLMIILFFIFTRDNPREQTSFTPFTSDSATSDDSKFNQIEGKAIVDIKGEIRNPGVYELDIDARVNDVIQLAGGFTNTADQSMINLAQKVHDEMIIIVPEKGEESNGTQNSHNNKIRINYASQEEVETLSGIGPSKAAAIIQYREENGLFQQVEDLLEVSGIGEKTLETIREEIQIP